MANVYLYKPTNIAQPQLSIEELERFGEIKLYSADSNKWWAGTGDFGYGIDIRYDGIGLEVGTSNGSITGMAMYTYGDAELSIDSFDIPVSRFVNFTHGEPLAQTGIFDGADYMLGSDGGDLLKGYNGSDELSGRGGNDEIRAGDGRDIIWGGDGSDILYGGFGRNTFKWEQDGNVDTLYIMSDQWLVNPFYNSIHNPNGIKVDTIYSLDSFDRVLIQGVSSDMIEVRNYQGNLGIFTGGYLEAIYEGSNLSASQLQSMTYGVDV